ncbi:metallophosphoesterase family protein [Myxococcota bacterium]
MGETAVILHLSDIHRTKDEPASNSEILLALKEDLKCHASEDVPSPNLVVVSGDVTQSAHPTEYDEAKAFLSELMSFLELPQNRLVVVPGNHDVHWPTSEEAYRPRVAPPAGIDADLVTQQGGLYLCPANEEEYQKRFAHFTSFCQEVTGNPYPAGRAAQWTWQAFPDLGVGFVGFSSCDVNDHISKKGRIHPDTIAAAADMIRSFPGSRVAVWHHDIDWGHSNRGDVLDIHSLRLVSTAPFHLGLCGHMHKPTKHNVHKLDGFDLPIVAAGTLCAGPRQREESVPRSYNIVAIQGGCARVFVRFKEERSTPWHGRGDFPHPADPRAFVSWYDVPFPAASGRSPTQLEKPRSATTTRAPTPFLDQNAKQAARDEVMREYVWTAVADELDSNIPQIVLGPRGSGKTALLLSLTFDGRRLSPRYDRQPSERMHRVGLLCPLRLNDVTALLGKGWVPIEDRRYCFAALLATLWGDELVNTFENMSTWAQDGSASIPSDKGFADLAGKLWFGRTGESSCQEIRLTLKRLRADVVTAGSCQDESTRTEKRRALENIPLLRGGPGPLNDIGDMLRKWSLFADTNWIVLFDEVEFLNDWQQHVVYDFVAGCTPKVSCKIATLPYAHAKTIGERNPPLVDGEDYRELPLSLTAELEFREVVDLGNDDSTKTFVEVAAGIWRARLEKAGCPALSLDEVWPSPQMHEVVAAAAGLSGREGLETALIEDLSPRARERAANLRKSDAKAFSDQYWRRYQRPFYFRLATKGDAVPLYWGWQTLLRACDGNCRRFLQLAEECWRLYWRQDGIRPLTPSEQSQAVSHWAKARVRVVASLSRELLDVIEQIKGDLAARLYGGRYLTEESLRVQIRSLAGPQAEAIAVGIAYGYFVPRMVNGLDSASMAYPQSDVELRLGYPVAARYALPLRTGTVLTIDDLRQVVFPWLKE